jgi:uncharacterized protein involved in exopolysaccharide biosynthesis
MIEQNQVPIQNYDDEITLKDLVIKSKEIFKYLVSRWKIILFMGILGSSLGLAYSLNQKIVYKAQYSFALEDDKSSGLGGALGLASQFGLNLGGGGGDGVFSGENLMELMRSRVIVTKALLRPITVKGKSQSLVAYYIEVNDMRKGWVKDPILSKLDYPINADVATFNREQDSIMMLIHKTVIEGLLSVAKLDKKLSIFKVEVKSIDEVFAKTFTEALVQEVSSFYVSTKTKKALENVKILQFQTDSVRNQLNQAIVGVAQTTDNTLNLNQARQVLKTPSQRRQIDVQANSAILTELVKNLEISKLSLRRETPLIQAIDKPVLPLPIQRVGKFKSMLTGGFIAGFLIVAFLLSQMFFKGIMK